MGNKSIFKRGYSASREEKQRQDKARENAGKKLWRFFLKDDKDEADVRFLTEEPVNFAEHNIKRGDRFEQHCCIGEGCPYCEDGDKPVYKGAYLIVDKREYEYTDQNGKKQKGKNQVRLFVQGMRVVSQLDRISEKYGLSNRDVTIVRLGKGTSTTYTIERGEKEVLSRKQIEALLPDKIRDEYDGTMDSLMSIVEKQLLMDVEDVDDEDEDDDDVEETSSSRERLISYGDDDDDEESDEDEEPVKKKLSSGKSKKLFKKSEHSLKRAKSLLKQ